MTAHWLQESKLAPPLAPQDRLPRRGLVEAAGQAPITLLLAGPGYGKTYSLLTLVEALPGPEPIVLWYSLDEADADPISFFQHLLAGMRRHIPDFAGDLDATLRAAQPDPAACWRSFFGELASYNLPAFALVLDDLHYLADAAPGWVTGMGPCLARLPAGARCLFSSRRAPPLPIARMKAAGGLVVLGPEALRFTADEAQAFLHGRAAPGDADTWSGPIDLMEGWPLGLHMWCTQGAKPDPRDWAASGVLDYVAEELYRTQAAPCQAFMLRAALLDALDVATCQALFPDGEAARWLRHLEGEHLAQRLGGAHGHRLPNYLREFLRAEIPQAMPRSELLAWHGTAAAHYLGADRPDLAFPHLIGAMDWASARQACAMAFPALAAAGRYDPIERWLAAFPLATAARDGFLRLWQGHVLARRGDAEAALAVYEDAQRLSEAAGEASSALKALLRRCTSYAYGQQGERLEPLMAQAEGLLGAGDDVDRADWLLVKVLIADQLGDDAAVRGFNAQILTLDDPRPEVSTARWIARVNLYTAHLQRGELDAARHHVDGAIDLAERAGFGPYALFSRFLRAHLALEEGEIEAAETFLQGLPAGWEESLEWQDLGSALTIAGEIHQRRGDLKAAETALARALTIFTRAKHPLGRLLPLERLAWLAIARGQPARAIALCDDAKVEGTNHYVRALTLARARAMHELGELEAAWALWEPLVTTLGQHEAHLLLAKARLFGAATLGGLGRTEDARAWLAQAERDCQVHGFAFLRASEPALWQALASVPPPAPVPAALPEAPADDETPPPTPPQAPPPPPPPPPPQAPTATLEIRCFGAFEVRLGGTLVTHWPRRKAKRVLAALAIHPRGLGVADLAELLEESSPNAAGLVRTVMTSLRRVLEPTLATGGNSAYITSRDEHYVLADDAAPTADVRTFEAAIRRGMVASRTDFGLAAAAFEEALAVYRGDLLADATFAEPFAQERQRYKRDALAALHFLADFHVGRGDRTSAEAALHRAAALAPTDEEPCLALIRFMVSQGRVERARQAYWDYRKALKALLALAPSPEFEAAYRAATAGATPRDNAWSS